MASTFSNWSRRACRLEVAAGPGTHARLGDFQRLAAQGDRLAHEADFLIQGAQLEVVRRQLGLDAEQDIVHRIGRCGGIGARALVGAADLAPEVQFPAKVGHDVVGRPVIAQAVERDRRGLILRGALAVGTERQAKRWQVIAPRHTRRRARLFKAGQRGLQILVGGAGARHQVVELGVAKHLPPLALGQMGDRIGRAPGDALELGRQGGVGPLIIGTDLGDRGRGGEEDEQEAHGYRG
jgi:hypothetical protein